MNDLISRQAAVDLLKKWADGYRYIETETELAIKEFQDLPSAQPEYTGHEESILTMLFGIAELIIDLQGGYMGMTDGRFFDNNDLFGLAEKLGINY